MTRIEPFTSTVSLWMARVGGGAPLGVALLISVVVSLRMVRLGNMSVGTELSSYALAIGATWSLAYVVFERGRVRVDIIARKLSAVPRTMLDVLSLASLAIIGIVLSVGA